VIQTKSNKVLAPEVQNQSCKNNFQFDLQMLPINHLTHMMNHREAIISFLVEISGYCNQTWNIFSPFLTGGKRK
jgi:hypothetical protein